MRDYLLEEQHFILPVEFQRDGESLTMKTVYWPFFFICHPPLHVSRYVNTTWQPPNCFYEWLITHPCRISDLLSIGTALINDLLSISEALVADYKPIKIACLVR